MSKAEDTVRVKYRELRLVLKYLVELGESFACFFQRRSWISLERSSGKAWFTPVVIVTSC